MSEVAPPLSVIGRAYGTNTPTAWLISILSEWQEALPVPGKMPVFQLHLLAENIMRKFYYLKVSEIMLFLARLAGGAYQVSWYNQISPDIIIDTLANQFIPDRDRIIRIKEMQNATSTSKTSKPITWEEYCRRHGKPIDTPPPTPTMPKLD